MGSCPGDLVPREEDDDNLLILRLRSTATTMPTTRRSSSTTIIGCPPSSREGFAFVHGIKQIFKALQIALL